MLFRPPCRGHGPLLQPSALPVGARHARDRSAAIVKRDYMHRVAAPDGNLYEPYSFGMKRTAKTTSRGAEQARQQLPAILAEAAAGRATIITRRGREVAAVVPIAAARLSKVMPLTTLAGTGRGLWGKRSTQTITRLRDEWNR